MAAVLRHQLGIGQSVVAPGAYDPLVARLIEREGFTAVHMGGNATSAAIFGRPDLGLTTLTEMVACARNMAAAINIPMIADADTGYGDMINVQRTVAEYESAGVAAIHLEDEARPSKDADGTLLVPTDVMVSKLRAAADARQDPDFLIIARSDALRKAGLSETLQRARAYLHAGADALFILKMQDRAELEAFPQAFPGVPLVFNMTARGVDLGISVAEAESLGYKIVIAPNFALLGAVKAVTDLVHDFRLSGTLDNMRNRLATAEDVDDLTGLTAGRALQLRYRIADNAKTTG